jgi:ribonuclease HI
VGWLKANWDAAVDLAKGHLGMGIVIQDHMGEIWAAKCVYMQGYLETHDAEGLAAFYAIQLSKETGVTNLILEGDAKSIHGGRNECKELKKQSNSRAKRGTRVVQEEKEVMNLRRAV